MAYWLVIMCVCVCVPFWQCVPSYPSVQSHSYSSRLALQVPPLAHGFSTHGWGVFITLTPTTLPVTTATSRSFSVIYMQEGCVTYMKSSGLESDLYWSRITATKLLDFLHTPHTDTPSWNYWLNFKTPTKSFYRAPYPWWRTKGFDIWMNTSVLVHRDTDWRNQNSKTMLGII